VAASGVNPLTDYLQQGWAEGRDPNPLFQSRWYLERYPDVAQAGINPLVHYLRFHTFEERLPRPLVNHQLIDEVSRTIRAFANIEPQFAALVDSNLETTHQIALRDDKLAPVWRELYNALDFLPKLIILLPTLNDLNDELPPFLAGLCGFGDKFPPLILVTDDCCEPPLELPVRFQSFRLLRLRSSLGESDRAMLVKTLLHSLLPEMVVNLDSKAGWRCFAEYGHVLSQFMRIRARIVGEVNRGDATDVLINRFFRACFPSFEKVYLNDLETLQSLKQRYGIPDEQLEKLAVLAVHPDPTTTSQTLSPDSRLRRSALG
jgi:hypothetical protein